jgi:hypothetical protein
MNASPAGFVGRCTKYPACPGATGRKERCAHWLRCLFLPPCQPCAHSTPLPPHFPPSRAPFSFSTRMHTKTLLPLPNSAPRLSTEQGLVTDDQCSAAADAGRKECATPGKAINEKVCLAKGCCWRAGTPSEPWCFHPAEGGATPKPKAPQKPAEPTPPLTTPKFIRPTPPPAGWRPGQDSRSDL